MTAVQWLQGTLLGKVATTAATIAVASIGLMMLMGRVDIRRGATVIVGCFILFGATTIIAGLQPGFASNPPAQTGVPATPISPPLTAPPLPSPSPTPYDPYAGASLGG